VLFLQKFLRSRRVSQPGHCARNRSRRIASQSSCTPGIGGSKPVPGNRAICAGKMAMRCSGRNALPGRPGRRDHRGDRRRRTPGACRAPDASSSCPASIGCAASSNSRSALGTHRLGASTLSKRCWITIDLQRRLRQHALRNEAGKLPAAALIVLCHCPNCSAMPSRTRVCVTRVTDESGPARVVHGAGEARRRCDPASTRSANGRGGIATHWR